METPLLDKFNEAQNNEEAMTKLISLFLPKVYKCLKHTNDQEKDDLFQELYLNIYLCIKTFNTDQITGFFELKDSIENSS
ncbi:hypothetical protein P8838_02110 [Bacillus spizizenii]|nr:hypothetical protein [Bacillus spizizenii]MDU7578635.1 hypothetical protein [Bacillus subtilis]MCY8430780.1 hypothetical protein [Bacillus spizizenii]MCY8442596.1 hypothetical protein [Bacillus spizizenii]MCY8446967.1 hypothetical protein [Bacillus spizizenii]